MSRVIVSRVIDAPVDTVWEVFTDLPGRVARLSEVERVDLLTPGPLALGSRWRETRLRTTGTPATAELIVTGIEPGRCCTMALAGADSPNHLTYLFSPVEIGSHRGGTAVSVVAEAYPHGLANRLLQFILGGFAARTVEGALRAELDGLAVVCAERRSSDPAAA
jgi:uncharacterized membrane protein